MKSVKRIMKKAASLALVFSLAFSAFAGIGKVANAAEADATTTLLKDYASKQTFIDTTKTYDGMLIRPADKNLPIQYSAKNVPTDPVGYRIDDFDGDGANELLVIAQDTKHNAELVMYEVVDSAVKEADRTKLLQYEEEDELYIDSALTFSSGDSAYFTYVQAGKKYIVGEQFNISNYNADGIGWAFVRTTYDGSKFVKPTDADKFVLSGSDFGFDETKYYVAMKLYELGITIEPKKAVTGDFRVRDFIPHKVVFASSQIKDEDVKPEIFEKMKDDEELKASTISFKMENSVVADTDDQEDIGAPSYAKLVPGKITVKSVTASKGKLVIKWKKSPAAYGYQVSVNGKNYSASSSAGKLSIKAKKGKKYKVKVRAYARIAGTNRYGAWSAVKSVKAK